MIVVEFVKVIQEHSFILLSEVHDTNSALIFGPTHKFPTAQVMTHKYRGCIVVLSINKSVEPNEEQKVLTSSFDQGITVNTSKRVFRGI
jgi:hypothetical protein